MSRPKIGFTGCIPEMPSNFPIGHSENSGNMVHASAPSELFPGSFYSKAENMPWGADSSFKKWVNNHATHLIVTTANMLRLDRDWGERHAQFQRQLESYDAEIVIFGLGAQAQSTVLSEAAVEPETIALMKYLGERCKAIGVRGEFTQKVFAHFADVHNTFVTGCPSTFTRPEAIEELHLNWKQGKLGRKSYAGTQHFRPEEKKMLVDSIKFDNFLIEPVSRANHEFHLACLRQDPDTDEKLPYYLRGKVLDGTLTMEEVRSYYARHYRLFRDIRTWYDFNRDYVSFSYGSRFHVNMAAHLSGVPALWITHDSRTAELTDFLHLPSIDLETAHHLSPVELRKLYDPTDFFDHVHSLFSNFADYLDIFGLPAPKLRF